MKHLHEEKYGTQELRKEFKSDRNFELTKAATSNYH
jgi:hypothetical protein